MAKSNVTSQTDKQNKCRNQSEFNLQRKQIQKQSTFFRSLCQRCFWRSTEQCKHDYCFRYNVYLHFSAIVGSCNWTPPISKACTTSAWFWWNGENWAWLSSVSNVQQLWRPSRTTFIVTWRLFEPGTTFCHPSSGTPRCSTTRSGAPGPTTSSTRLIHWLSSIYPRANRSTWTGHTRRVRWHDPRPSTIPLWTWTDRRKMLGFWPASRLRTVLGSRPFLSWRKLWNRPATRCSIK